MRKPNNSGDKITVIGLLGAEVVALLLTGYWDLLGTDHFSEVVTFCVMTLFYCLFYLL